MAGSWFQRPEALRWTLYSNAGGVTKENDHVLIDVIYHNKAVYQV